MLLGLSAHDALYDLSEDARWSGERRGYWLPTDRRAFEGWLSVEYHVPDAQADPEITAEQLSHVDGLLFKYRAALPYNEAERYWLFGVLDDLEHSRGLIGVIRRHEGQIVSGGLRQVVYGRDLTRRWWAWRRQIEQFQGQGTVDVAREALRELIEIVDPDCGLPEPYLRLRGRGGSIPAADT